MQIKRIPTNIITGALGVGKTTVIQKLLDGKPEDERWAVLVNEFGEVGIDGAILAGQSDDANSNGIFIKEVPGGCMCCTSGLPMQIALNLLLTQAKPDRLLIEPTGLGHPKEVMETLTEEHYQDVLDINATLTLIDVRKLDDPKWRAHETFQEQMDIADYVVITKSDLHTQDYSALFNEYANELNISNTPVVVADNGEIDINILGEASKHKKPHKCGHSHEHNHDHHHDHASDAPLEPTLGNVVSVKNKGEGFFSRGWICGPEHWLDYEDCRSLFSKINVERLKAVVITDNGYYSFNVTDGNLEEKPIAGAQDSRIELISSEEAVLESYASQIETLLKASEAA